MAYQSLYRRYRPRRFSDVRGQEHVIRALRNAVREDRVGHAYLFSGPRGTGKTSTARILAKALNCENVVDGEPDGTCPSCVAIDAGGSYDVQELDAASNNRVDDVRDLISRVALGSPGRTKVYILDEVHMLTAGASAALLKTLEEPPEHVVFVLATTDPQKVMPTIRSRTQHYPFHLLSVEELSEHVAWVIHDANLDLPDSVIDHVVRAGAGSARDTLSELDQVAAAGGVVDAGQPLDALLDAVAASDVGAALLAVAEAIANGSDPRVLGEAVLARLRDIFLLRMGGGSAHLPPGDLERVQAWADQLGDRATTRALEAVGDALLEMRQAPDPRIPLEVALVKVTRADVGTSLDGLTNRVAALEAARAAGATPPGSGNSSPQPSGSPPSGSPPGGGGPAPVQTPPADQAAPTPPSTGRPAPPPRPGPRPADGIRAQLAASRGDRPAPPPRPGAAPSASPGPAPDRSPSGPAPAPPAPSGDPGSSGGAESAGGTGSFGNTGSAGDAGSSGSTGSSGDPRSVDPTGSSGPPSSSAAGAPPRSDDGPPPADTASTAHAASAPDPSGPSGSPTSTALDSAPSGRSTGSAAGSPTGSGTPAPTGSPSESDAPSGSDSPPAASSDQLTAVWEEAVLPSLGGLVKAMYSVGRFTDVDGATATLALPNEVHRQKCEQKRSEVEAALSQRLDHPIRLRLVVDGGSAPDDRSTMGHDGAPGPSGRPPEPGPDDFDLGGHDVHDLDDAPDGPTGGMDALTEAFPGAELVEGQ